MCEILLCVKDRGNSGILGWDSKMPKQGDVVVVAPDGWAWSAAELGTPVPGNPNGNHNFFRILKLPNVTVVQASNMLSPELDVDPQNPSPYLQYRARYLDKTKVPPGPLFDNLLDDLRANPFITLAYTAAQFSTIVTVRTPVPF